MTDPIVMPKQREPIHPISAYIPKALLRRATRKAKQLKTSRNALLVAALEDYLSRVED